ARVRRVGEAARREIPVEARLVDGVQGAEPHAHRGELPEVRHQARVRIAREPGAALHLAAEVLDLRLRETALEERARIDARRGMALEEHLVARTTVVLA